METEVFGLAITMLLLSAQSLMFLRILVGIPRDVMDNMLHCDILFCEFRHQLYCYVPVRTNTL